MSDLALALTATAGYLAIALAVGRRLRSRRDRKAGR
jgi:hypothetical protein